MDPTMLKGHMPLTAYAVDIATGCQLMVVLRSAASLQDMRVFTAEDSRSVRVLVADPSDRFNDPFPDPASGSASVWLKQPLASRRVIDGSTGREVRRLHPREAEALLRRHQALDELPGQDLSQ